MLSIIDFANCSDGSDEIQVRPAAAVLPPVAEQPTLFAALLGGQAERALELVQGGANPHDTLLCGLTALHAAALGGAAGAVAALVAAGVPVDARLSAPLQLPDQRCGQLFTDEAPAGSTALALACAMGEVPTVQALLAAGAASELPDPDSWRDLLKPGASSRAASPWHWLAERMRYARPEDESEMAAAIALRASLLGDVLRRAAAGSLEMQPEQLMAMLMAAALAPSAPDLLAELAALLGAAGMLGAEQRCSVASLAVHQGDAAAVQTMLDGPLRQQPIDPDGSMLETVAGRSSDDVLPIARALLQHGTSITLPAINKVVNRRRNAELLELMLGSGLPLPAVPLGSEEESVTMFFGEYDTTESTHDVCCPFYSLFRRDCHYITKTPQELRVRMCQALLRAGYRPTVYNSVRLLVVSKTGYGCQSKSLPNFHILRDWGRLGRTADGTGRICCSPGADPQQDKLLTGDNRLLWMLIEGEPWSPADHRYWPPAFKAAVRTLLLAHRRGAPVKRGLDAPTAAPAAAELQATPLSPLPHAFVLAVIAAVAFPLNAWFDAASMEDWRAAEFWHEMDFAAWGFTQQAAQELDEQADL